MIGEKENHLLSTQISKAEKLNEDLVSVITVCLNSKDTLEKTILSVLGQTYNNFEYLIIDGGSIDGTLDIIKKYEGKISYWVSEKDKGIYNAMNKGIKKSSGKWVHILNSDDVYFSKDSLEMALDRIKGAEKDKFFYFTMKRDYGYGKFNFQKYPFNFFNKIKLFYSAYIPHPTLLVRKEQYKNTGLYDESFKIASDHDFILRILKKYKTEFIDIPLVIMSQKGISSKNNIETFREFKNVTIKNGLPKFIAEAIFKLKLFKMKLFLN